MTYIIPQEYHPKNGIKTHSAGGVETYRFKDGHRLIVRKAMKEQLFRDWELSKKLSKDNESNLYTAENHKVVVRSESNAYLRDLVNGYRRAYIARARIESPIAVWGRGPMSTIITTFKEGHPSLYTLYKKKKTVDIAGLLPAVFRELGKLHGAGVQHGHPHFDNIVTDEKGKISLIDPKFIADSRRWPKDIANIGPRDRYNIESKIYRLAGYAPKIGQRNDLAGLIDDMLATKISWDKRLIVAYKKGYSEGKRRLEAFRKREKAK